jgi:hypothetical protein
MKQTQQRSDKMPACSMNPEILTWDKLIRLSRSYQGIVFLNLRDENVPHFILDLAQELMREKITSSDAPCEIFIQSGLVNRPAERGKDLALFLKGMKSPEFDRLCHWQSQQTPHAMSLSDYIATYGDGFEHS